MGEKNERGIIVIEEHNDINQLHRTRFKYHEVANNHIHRSHQTRSRFLSNSSSSIATLEIQASMEANRGQNGIHHLLAAEQEAQLIVNAARNEKLARLKQANDEAEREVAQFRAQMEADFQKKLAESSGDSGANVKRLEEETGSKIQFLKSDAGRISHDVANMLLKQVTTVRS